jgi:hypothetical protein
MGQQEQRFGRWDRAKYGVDVGTELMRLVGSPHPERRVTYTQTYRLISQHGDADLLESSDDRRDTVPAVFGWALVIAQERPACQIGQGVQP